MGFLMMQGMATTMEMVANMFSLFDPKGAWYHKALCTWVCAKIG